MKESKLSTPLKKRKLNLRQKIQRIVAVISFYVTVSVLLVFLNKYVLSYIPDQFEFPLFITWIQLVVQLIFTVVMGFLGSK
jgi:hypothetical protein